MKRTPRLEFDGLGVTKGRDAVSLAIGAGECVALLTIGRAGASSLLDRLAGYGVAAVGRILVDGADVTARPPGKRRIGVISQRDPLFDHLTVRQNVAFALAVRRVGEPERGHRVGEMLALLGLDAQAACRPAALSASDAIRTALARALTNDPAVLLLDNPLLPLAPPARRDMHQLLRRLARARGLALLLVTGDRDEALMVGERIGLLDASGLRQLGTATELLDRPVDEVVAVAFAEANRLSGRVEWVEDDVARIRLSAGPSMDAMAAEGLAAGALCVVCIRPERIAVAFVSTDDALGGDALSSTLTDIVHLGDHLRLRFRLNGGGELLVRRPASQPVAGLRIERPALLAWQAAHAIAFPFDA